mmetsp:Transcript_11615/g.16587  ORF Transcript_11615/g.16587 Transcript_11615/m.16587 type:complete len:91 (+) Transcript_11615:2131-2403(+)
MIQQQSCDETGNDSKRMGKERKTCVYKSKCETDDSGTLLRHIRACIRKRTRSQQVVMLQLNDVAHMNDPCQTCERNLAMNNRVLIIRLVQ